MSLDSIITLVIILCVYMWPLAIIANSNRTRGNEKTYWMLVTVFLSWVGLFIYRITTLSEEERRQRQRDKLIYERKKANAERKKKLKEQQHQAAQPEPIEPQEMPQEPPFDPAKPDEPPR